MKRIRTIGSHSSVIWWIEKGELFAKDAELPQVSFGNQAKEEWMEEIADAARESGFQVEEL